MPEIPPSNPFRPQVETSQPEVQLTPEMEAAKQEMIVCLSQGYIYGALKIKDQFSLSAEIISSPEVQDAATQGMIKRLSEGWIDEVLQIKQKFAVPNEVAWYAARQGIINCLSGRRQESAFDIKQKFAVPDEIISSPEVQAAAKLGIIFCLSNYNIESAFDIKQRFAVPDEIISSPEVQAAAEQLMIVYLSHGRLYDTLKIKQEFRFPDEFIMSPEVQAAAKQGLIMNLTNADINNVLKIKQEFRFPDEFIMSPEVQAAAKQGMIFIFSRGGINRALKIMQKFAVPDKIALEAAKQGIIGCLIHGQIGDVIIIKQELGIPDEFIMSPEVKAAAKQGMIVCLSSNDLDDALKINNLSSPPLDRAFTRAYDFLGDRLTLETYGIISGLLDGTIDESKMRELGITKTGETGINQLRQKLASFNVEILNPCFDGSVLKSSAFYRQYFQACVRYKNSDYGNHDETWFDEAIKTYQRFKQEGALRELPLEYAPSGEMRIAKVNREKQEAFEYSEQFLQRFKTFQSSILGALEMLEQKRPLSSLVEKAETKRLEVLKTLKGKLDRLDNPKAVASLTERISSLERLNLRSVENFQANFEVLAQFGEFHEELRRLAFYHALHKNRTYRESAKELALRDQPQFNDVGWMINFIDHIVNEETWSEYFTDHKAAKAFRKLININALSEEFSRAQNQEVQGTAAMEFIPTRGLLMEFSGHIADACWAGEYDSIAKEFPNFTAVIMVQNRGTKHERLAGACLLIETQAQDGTPLLVIRGLNPIENTINALSVEDFYQKFTDYITQIAERTGRRPAIVIDDHTGGSATNRPALFEFIAAKAKTLKRASLASEEDTTFNGYDITDSTYLVK